MNNEKEIEAITMQLTRHDYEVIQKALDTYIKWSVTSFDYGDANHFLKVLAKIKPMLKVREEE